jgi:hypothetical protein
MTQAAIMARAFIEPCSFSGLRASRTPAARNPKPTIEPPAPRPALSRLSKSV